MRISKTFDYRSNVVHCDGEGVVIVGKIDKEKGKIKLHLGKTLLSQLAPALIYGLFFLIGMAATAFLGLIAALIMKLAGTDASTLTNWFFDIFRFGTASNMILAGILPAWLYIKGLIAAIIAFIQAKREF